MNFNAYFIWKDPNEEVDEYLRCERKWIIHHSTCSSCDWDQIGSKTCYILKVRKKISLLTDLKVSFLACKCKFYKPKNAKGRPWNQNLKVFKWKNEIYKRIELLSLKFQKWLNFCILCWWWQKVSHNSREIFKYVWKMLYSPVRKFYW